MDSTDKITLILFMLFWAILLGRSLLKRGGNAEATHELTLGAALVHLCIATAIVALTIAYNRLLAERMLPIAGFAFFGLVVIRSTLRTKVAFSWQPVAMTRSERIAMLYAGVFVLTGIGINVVVSS